MFSQSLGLSPWQGYERPGWTTVTLPHQLREMEQMLDQTKLIAFDYETSGLEWWRKARPCGYAFAAQLPGEMSPRCWYVPYRHRTGQAQIAEDKATAALQHQLERTDREIVAHGARFELQMSWIEKLDIKGQLHDTMPQAHLLDENRRVGLKYLTASDLNDPEATRFEDALDEEVEQLAKMNGVTKTAYRDAHGYADVDIWLAGLYGNGDVWNTLQLHLLYGRMGVRDYWAGVYETERQLVRVLAEMQWVGVPVSIPRLQNLAQYSFERMAHYTKLFTAATGATIELTNDNELRDVLLQRGAKLTKLTESEDAFSLDAEVLTELSKTFPEAGVALQYREAKKCHSTYAVSLLDKVDEWSLVHCDIKAEGTVTGRMAASKPNLTNQTIFPPLEKSVMLPDGKPGKEVIGPNPLSVRYCFDVRRQPSPFWTNPPAKQPRRLSTDYGQVELRTLAEGSRDARMVHAFAHDLDLHTETEKAVFGTEGPNRRPSKIINFGLAFGMTAKGLAAQVGVSLEVAENYLKVYFEKFPGMDRFRHQLWDFATKNGGKFDNMYGRTQRIPGLLSSNKWDRLAAERETIARFAQGSAADLMKAALVRVHNLYKAQGWNVRMSLVIHDDLQTDCEAEQMDEIIPPLTGAMTSFPMIFKAIPIRVDHKYFEESWDEFHHHKVKKKAA